MVILCFVIAFKRKFNFTRKGAGIVWSLEGFVRQELQMDIRRKGFTVLYLYV